MKNEFYYVINIPFQMNLKLLDSNWKMFSSDCKNSLFALHVLNQKNIEYHGLEYYLCGKNIAYIVRRENDIMLIDSAWKKASVLPVV